MTTFYTNVQVWGGRILYRGVDNNGKKIRQKLDYSPTLFTPSKTETAFKTIQGEYVAPINPGSIRDTRDFTNQYENVDGFRIYGNQKYEYTFISDQHPHEVDWDINEINICNIDIEVGSENGFPEPDTANEPITAITLKNKNTFMVFGCGNFNNVREDVKYIKCRDEIDLIKRFIDEWSGNYPDIITGWNVKMFDIPYLVNRITKMLGEDFAKRLSPWNIINEREISFNFDTKKLKTYTLVGISNLDYIELYKKYAPDGKSQESYKLDSICNVELGERKLSYEEYGNIFTLLSHKSQKIEVDDKKPIENMAEFEKWCLLRDRIKKELKTRNAI